MGVQKVGCGGSSGHQIEMSVGLPSGLQEEPGQLSITGASAFTSVSKSGNPHLLFLRTSLNLFPTNVSRLPLLPCDQHSKTYSV